MARHALVDLTQVFYVEPQNPVPDRLDHAGFERLAALLHSRGCALKNDPGEAEPDLATLRGGYEPFAYALSRRLLLSLPPWIPADDRSDDWQVSPWDRMASL
jgi:hypothetical protein